MNPRLLAVGFAILAGCGTSADTRYQNGRALLKKGKFAEAMREADAGMGAQPSWRFRILKADVLIARGEAKAVKDLLASAPPPTEPEK